MERAPVQERREDIHADVTARMQAFQASVDAFDGVAAERLGVTRVELRCLEVLVRDGRASPGGLGPVLGLTSGGVTQLLARLEKRGYLIRDHDREDRRRVAVLPTERLVTEANRLYGPIAREGAHLLESYSDLELRLIEGFLCRSLALYQRHLARVRSIA
jgi:DNA-binding MarR family transcriptional regulator